MASAQIYLDLFPLLQQSYYDVKVCSKVPHTVTGVGTSSGATFPQTATGLENAGQ